jgi:hypothetical protein
MRQFQCNFPARVLAPWGRIACLPVLLALSLTACSTPEVSPAVTASGQGASEHEVQANASMNVTPLQASRERMRKKFGNLGAELRVDAIAGQEFFGVEFLSEGSDRYFYSSSRVALENREIMSMPLEIPERVMVVWRESDHQPVLGKRAFLDRVIGTETIEVGSRIPQEVIDSLRREGGGLRLKFRLSNDGVYFGWDIERRPGYDPNKRDPVDRTPYYVAPVFSMVGGDFQEAKIVGGAVVRQGWYIDKKTGKKIDTDF